MKKNELEKLKEYSKALDNLAKNSSKDKFPNKDHKHAAIALSKVLKYSNESFILFDDNLNGDVVKFNEVESFKKSLLDFISRNGKVKIVISDKNKKDNFELKLFLEVVSELYPNLVFIKIASKKFKSEMRKIYNEKINFAIGDDNKYRLEKFGENHVDDKTRSAEGSFNNYDVVEELKNVFEYNFGNCENYF